MGILKIHCGACGGSWELYYRDIYNKEHRTCPHCGEEIDQQTYERQIIPAWAALIDANTELYKDNLQGHKAIFTVDYIAGNTLKV